MAHGARGGIGNCLHRAHHTLHSRVLTMASLPPSLGRYLFRLADAMRSMGVVDEELFHLEVRPASWRQPPLLWDIGNELPAEVGGDTQGRPPRTHPRAGQGAGKDAIDGGRRRRWDASNRGRRQWRQPGPAASGRTGPCV